MNNPIRNGKAVIRNASLYIDPINEPITEINGTLTLRNNYLFRKFQGYVSLINSNGELMTLEINEELSEGVRLVELRRNEAVFEKGEDSFLIINFKNQIKETSGEY